MHQGHKKLDVWKEGVAFASDIYRVTESFPKHEIYGHLADAAGRRFHPQ